MEEITLYTSSDGKTQPIAELSPFHLMNALIKSSKAVGIGECIDMGEGSLLQDGYVKFLGDNKLMMNALKAEVLRRLLPLKEEEIKAEDLPY